MPKRKNTKKNKHFQPEQEEKKITKVPHEFYCPITQQIMRQPVIASDGRSYEHVAIERWYRQHQKSPITRQPISDIFYANNNLKNLIEDFLISFPQFNQERISHLEIRNIAVRPFVNQNLPVRQANIVEDNDLIEPEDVRTTICDQLSNTMRRLNNSLYGLFHRAPEHKIEIRNPRAEAEAEENHLRFFTNHRLLRFLPIALQQRDSGLMLGMLALICALELSRRLTNSQRVRALWNNQFFNNVVPDAVDQGRHIHQGGMRAGNIRVNNR